MLKVAALESLSLKVVLTDVTNLLASVSTTLFVNSQVTKTSLISAVYPRVSKADLSTFKVSVPSDTGLHTSSKRMEVKSLLSSSITAQSTTQTVSTLKPQKTL